MAHTLDSAKFPIVGNNLSLDFVNTEVAGDGGLKSLLETPADMVAWAVAVNLLESPQAQRLARNWREEPEIGGVAGGFAQAMRFRKDLRGMVEGLTRGQAVAPAVIKAINTRLREPSGYAEVRVGEDGFMKQFRIEIRSPVQLLAPIAEAAADLLCYGNLAYVKKCENPECVLYFYDTTKNHSRRWCSMAACGNRAKAAAFYQRQRKKPAG